MIIELSDIMKTIEQRDHLMVMLKPNSKLNSIIKFEDEMLYVQVKSQPVDGKANYELLKLLKKELKMSFEIISGSTSKKKLLKKIN